IAIVADQSVAISLHAAAGHAGWTAPGAESEIAGESGESNHATIAGAQSIGSIDRSTGGAGSQHRNIGPIDLHISAASAQSGSIYGTAHGDCGLAKKADISGSPGGRDIIQGTVDRQA